MHAAPKNAVSPSGNREIRSTPKDQELSRRTATFENAECAYARPKHRGYRDSPSDRLLSRMEAASMNAVCASRHPQNMESRGMPKICNSVEERPRPHSRTPSSPLRVRIVGNAETLSGRSVTQSEGGRAKERGARLCASESSGGRGGLSPKYRIPSRRTAAFKNAGFASARPKNQGNGESPKGRIPGRGAAASESSVCPPAHPKIGKAEERREIGKSVEVRPRSRTRIAPRPFRKSGKQRLAGRSVSRRIAG